MDHINKLPEEILRMIFDKLNMADAKQVSLVCRRWNGLVFGTSFINRFLLELDTKAMVTAMEEMVHIPAQIELPDVTRQRMILAEATKSNRPYRRVRWVVKECAVADHSWILQEIVPQYTHLVQLELIYRNTTANDLLPVLVGALPNMQRLRILILQDRGYYDGDFEQQLTLFSPSVELLELSPSRGYPIRVAMPNLRRFRGQLSCHPNGNPADEPFDFFTECHPLVTALYLEFSYNLFRSTVFATWETLTFFPNIEELTITLIRKDDMYLERLRAAALPRLRQIGFYVCSLSAEDIAKIRESVPSTVRTVFEEYPSFRPGSPFLD